MVVFSGLITSRFKNEFLFYFFFFNVLRHWGMGMVDEFIVCSFH